jgi:hypothetical protein
VGICPVNCRLLRGYNIEEKEILVTLIPWRRFKKAEKTGSMLKVERSGGVLVKAGGV